VSTRAVVIVSGGDAISPFTTPSQSCAQGLSAGSTDTALREALLDSGLTVYTSPANAGPGPVTVDSGFAGFSSPPPQPPESMTVNAVGPIDTAGRQLAAFLRHLAAEFAVSSVDLVGHSMGGLFARAAIRELRSAGHPLETQSLITVGTPWEGSFAADYANGHVPLSRAEGDQRTESIMTEFKQLNAESSTGAGEQVTRTYLAGGWNERQSGILDGIAVTLIGGSYFTHDGGSPDVWPHDGLVAIGSALASTTSAAVLPQRTSHTFDDVHSIYFANQFDLPWERGLTWDPAVLATVAAGLR
jgi:pimeloyl-ACP methyl ester carboxylesterase